jgi:hypothetical protein
MNLGVAGLRPNFFSSGRIFWAELAQESRRDLAAVGGTIGNSVVPMGNGKQVRSIQKKRIGKWSQETREKGVLKIERM